MATVFNEYSYVNQNHGKCFKIFTESFLNLKTESPDFSKITISVELQADRCCPANINTRFDALLTFEDDWIWGIEAKYFDILTTKQITTEYDCINELSKSLGYKNAGLLFIVPEEQLGSILYDKYFSEVLETLRKYLEGKECCVRLSSWEMLFDIICECGDEKLQKEIGKYLDLRNRNKIYSTKLYKSPIVKYCTEWEQIFMGNKTVKTLRKIPDSQNKFSHIGGSSSGLKEVFNESLIFKLAQMIIEISQLEEKSQKSGYTNLSKNKKAYSQIHPHMEGVALVLKIKEENNPLFSEIISTFRELPLNSLSGYRGSNKEWLEGRMEKFGGKIKAKAFLIPSSLSSEPLSSPQWTVLKSLFANSRGFVDS